MKSDTKSLAEKKYEFIIDNLNKGNTVYITTAIKSWEITKKLFDKFEKAGTPLFKIIKDSLYMARGKHYNSIDYVKISARSNNNYTETEVLQIVRHVLNELYGTPSPAETFQTKRPVAPVDQQANAIGRINSYALRDYSWELAPQLKTMAVTLGNNRLPVINMITGIFERLSPQWGALAKQKFMQLSGITSMPPVVNQQERI